MQNLFRNVCQTSAADSTFTGSSIVSHNVVNQSTGTGPPSAVISCSVSTAPSCAGTPPAWQTGWVSVSEVDNVSLPLTYASSNYKQTLLAVPQRRDQRPWRHDPHHSAVQLWVRDGRHRNLRVDACASSTSAPGTPQDGTPCGNGGLEITDGITNTPFTMSFCLSESSTNGGGVVGAAIPTYTDPPTSEAFLGNNGFYTGIPGNPALYQSKEGTATTVTITNIQVLGTGGVPATNWNLVTGDAESTDAGESMNWTAGWSAGSSVPAAQQVFTLVDNSRDVGHRQRVRQPHRGQWPDRRERPERGRDEQRRVPGVGEL